MSGFSMLCCLWMFPTDTSPEIFLAVRLDSTAAVAMFIIFIGFIHDGPIYEPRQVSILYSAFGHMLTNILVIFSPFIKRNWRAKPRIISPFVPGCTTLIKLTNSRRQSMMPSMRIGTLNGLLAFIQMCTAHTWLTGVVISASTSRTLGTGLWNFLE